jgi:lipopolysaccharide/colanic/teichoic acid biosynthesis glycosyltransferase
MKISTVQTDEARPQTEVRANNGAKRVFDIIFSVIALLLFLPSMLIIAFLISLDGGPVFLDIGALGGTAYHSTASSSGRCTSMPTSA